MISADEISQRITQAMPDAEVKVNDMTGGGDHYQVQVVSTAFEGVSPVKRHRLVYDTLRDVLGGELHALALRTLTPSET